MIINPTIDTIAELERVTWSPLLTAHKERSSVISVSDNYKFLKKEKRRKSRRRDGEFYNLAFWNTLLQVYRDETGSSVHSPTPYLSDKRQLVMEYAIGMDLDRILKSGATGSEELYQIMRPIGQLMKIKENEGMVHKDFDLRHLLLNGGLYVIDLENARIGNDESRKENDILIRLLLQTSGKDIKDAIMDGKSDVPQLSLADSALEKVKSIYGGRSEFFLKGRYRD